MTKGFSGKGGTAFLGVGDAASAAAISTEILEVVKWSLDPSCAVHKYNSNKTLGHKPAVAGVRDTKGTIEIKVPSDTGPQLSAGSAVSLKLRVDSSHSWFCKHAVIQGNPVDCDIDDGAIVSMTYNFEASDLSTDGAWLG